MQSVLLNILSEDVPGIVFCCNHKSMNVCLSIALADLLDLISPSVYHTLQDKGDFLVITVCPLAPQDISQASERLTKMGSSTEADIPLSISLAIVSQYDV